MILFCFGFRIGFWRPVRVAVKPANHRKAKSMRFSTLTKVLTLTLVLTLGGDTLTAGLFKNRSSSRAARSRNSAPASSQASGYSPYNSANRPMTRIGRNMVARAHEKDLKVSARTGMSVQEVEARRIRRLEIMGAIVGGMGAGLSGAASTMNTAPSTTTTTNRSGGLPSNFSNRMQMNAFNRSYSTNSSHAPVIYGR